MTRKQMDGQWQVNSYPDEGCRWSRGYKCVECPFPKCLDEYTPKNRIAMIAGDRLITLGGDNAPIKKSSKRMAIS